MTRIDHLEEGRMGRVERLVIWMENLSLDT